MDGVGRRQLPSWMMRSTATVETSTSETKGEDKENGSVKLCTKADEPQKKVEAKKQDKVVPLIENKSHLLKKCETRTRKRKSKKQDEEQGKSFEDEPGLLKPCKKTRSKRALTKHGEDQVDDFLDSDVEKKDDGVVRKRARAQAPRKKRSKESKEEFHNETEQFTQSEDELTVEDLVNIAKEYVKADREEFQKPKKSEVESETKPILRAGFEIGSEKNLRSCIENSLVTDQPLSSDSSLTKTLPSNHTLSSYSSLTKPVLRAGFEIGSEKNLSSCVKNSLVTDQPLSSDSSLTKPLPSNHTLSSDSSLTNPLPGDQSVISLKTTDDPARDMLELFLGPWLRKAEEKQRETNAMCNNIMLDYEISERSQNDTVADVAPVVKKKFSLKDHIGRLLD